MKHLVAPIALACAALAVPAAAEDPSDGLSEEQRAVASGVDAFFAALRSDDKTALAGAMVPEGMIFVHNHMDPENPRVVHRKASDHLDGWLNSPPGLDEFMAYEKILVDGDMGLVWGPYSFHVGDNVTHCGINSLSMVKSENGSWKVGNTSFTMVSPSRCTEVGADWVDGDDS